MLKDALRGTLDEKEIGELSSSFDVIGDIAILKIPEALEPKASLIGELLLQRVKNVTTVLSQVSDVGGEFRTRELALVAGVEKYESTYRESGCNFRVNVKSVYFSPRLATERARIARLVKDGERIFNMFAGLGTFSIVIAKEKNCTVDSVDKNPEALKLCVVSLKLNRRLRGTVLPILCDARDHALSNPRTFDRILMPLPERSSEFLQVALASAKDGACIHYYTHVPQEEFESDWIAKHLEGIGRAHRIANWKKVREVGPRYIQAVADIVLL